MAEAADGAVLIASASSISGELCDEATLRRSTRLEIQLGRLLVTGVTISAILLAIGLGLWLFHPNRAAAIWLLNAGLDRADGDADHASRRLVRRIRLHAASGSLPV